MSNDFVYDVIKDIVGIINSPNARQIVVRDFILSILLFNKAREFKRTLRSDRNMNEGVLFETHTHLYNEFHENYGKNNIDNFLEDIVKKNVGIIAFTDHESDKLFEEISKLKRKSRNYEVLAGERSILVESLNDSDKKLLILKGQEYSDGSHVGLIGYEGQIKRGLSYKNAIKEAHKKNGFAVAFHPLFFRGVLSDRWVKERRSPVDLPKLTDLIKKLVNEPFDFYELNGRLPYFLGVENVLLYSVLKDKVHLSAGSDAHSIKELGKRGILIKMDNFKKILSSKEPVDELYRTLMNNQYKLLVK